MKTIELNRQYKNTVVMERNRSIIYMNKTDFPYIEVSSIDVPNILTNSRTKIINGIFSGSDVTSIRARNHYPHSIGPSWCFGDPFMYGYGNTAIVSTGLNGEFWNGNNTKNALNKAGEAILVSNASVSKEYCFWSADDGTRLTSENKLAPYAMRYDIIEPYAPEYGDSGYYSDKFLDYGAISLIPFETPSEWTTASLNENEQTFEVEVNMLPFWYFQDTEYSQYYLNWKQTTSADIHKMHYDSRLQAIELEIHCKYHGEPIVGTRWIYVWHCPQSWQVPYTHKIQKVDGYWIDGAGINQCPGDPPSYYYNTGYAAAGGSVEVACGTSGEEVLFDKILLISSKSPNSDTLSFAEEVFNVSQIKKAWKALPSYRIDYPTLRNDPDTVNPDNSNTFDYCENINLSSISIEDGFIISSEFLGDGEFYIYLMVDYTDYKMGANVSVETAIFPSGWYCEEGHIGSILNKRFITVGTNCDDAHTIPSGTYNVYCETNLDLTEEGFFASGIHKAECDAFDSGSDLEDFTERIYYGGVRSKVENKGSDGDLLFTIQQGFLTSPKWYQNYYSLNYLPLYGYAGKDPSRVLEGYSNYPMIVNDLILNTEHTGIEPVGAIAERIQQI